MPSRRADSSPWSPPADRSTAAICLAAARAVDAPFPHGTWRVDLSQATETDDVAAAVADSLGVVGPWSRRDPADAPVGAALDPLEALEDGLGDDRALLVLLGCTRRHELSTAVGRLLERLPTVSLLVASTDATGQPGEHTVAIGPRLLPPDLQRLRTSPLLGRERELGLLREEAARAAGGQRRLVMVSGEEGMGKSRLVAELAAAFVADDGLVLRGAWREERVTDFQAFREAMARHFADAEPAVLRARFGDLLPVLDTLVPHDPAEIADRSPGDVDRFALLDALDTWLARLASAQPVLLWLDDLQWADPSSLQMLLHLARSPRPAPIVIATTHQPGALTRDDDVSHTLAQLRRAPGFTRRPHRPTGPGGPRARHPHGPVTGRSRALLLACTSGAAATPSSSRSSLACWRSRRRDRSTVTGRSSTSTSSASPSRSSRSSAGDWPTAPLAWPRR